MVHLVNFQPETGRELAHSRHQVQEIIPVRDLELIVRLERPIRRVRLEPGGGALEYEQEGGEARVRVGEVDCHRMVVMDLG